MKKATLFIFLFLAVILQGQAQPNAPISSIGTINSNLATPEVPIKVTNFSGITDCMLTINYDQTVVTPNAVTAGAGVSGTIITNFSNPGVIVITWFTWPGVTLSDNSTIFNLKFNKVATGTSALSFSDNGISCYWGDENYEVRNDIPFSTYYLPGSIRVGYAPVTTAPAITACPGQSVSVPVTVANFNNIGRIAALRMTFNSTALTYTGFTNTSGFPGLTVTNPSSGVLTVPATSQVAAGVTYANNSTLFTLNFTYNGGTSELAWADPVPPGTQCMYMGPAPYAVLTDTPTGSFYINGSVQPLVAPTIVKNPNVASVCITTPVSATFNAGSGGVSAQDLYESSIDGGANWQTYTPGSPLTATSAGTGQIRIRTWRTSVGTACTNSGYNTASWDVVANAEGGTLSGGATVCEGTNSTVLTLSGYFGTILKWQSSTNGSNWNDISNTLATYTATNLSATTQYRVVLQNGICDPVNSTTETITVNPLLPVSVSVTETENPACAGTEITFTAVPVNGGINPLYQWSVNGSQVSGATNVSYAFVPVNGDFVTCRLTSSESCTTGNPATSLPVTMTMNPAPVVTAAAVAFSLNPEGPWSGLSGDLATGYSICIDPQNQYYYLDLQSIAVSNGLQPGNLNGFKVDTTNLPPTWWSYWAGRGVNGSSGNQFPWQDMMWQIIHGLAPIFYIYETAGDPMLVDGLVFQLTSQITPLRLSGDYPQWNYSYRGNVTDVNSCISSFFDIFLEVNTVPVISDLDLLSSLSETGPFTAVGGSFSQGFNTCFDTVNTFYYFDIDNVVTSQPWLEGNMNPFVFDTTNLPSTWLTYWAGRGVFNSAGNEFPWQDKMWQVIHGLAPAFYLKYTTADGFSMLNGVSYQLDLSEVPFKLAGDFPQWNYQFKGQITDVNYCISSFFDIFLEVNHIPYVVPEANQEWCNGANVPEIVLEGTISGTTFTWVNDNPSIGLAASGFGNIPAFTATNSGSSVLSATITVTPSANGCEGAPVALYEIEVVPTTSVSVTISADANPVCEGTIVNFEATPVNGGATPAFQWQVNGIDAEGATDAAWSYIPVNNDAVTCILTSSETLCVEGNPATSNSLVMGVNPLIPVAVSIAADFNPVCAGTEVTITATPVNGGATPAYQWFVNSVEVTGATDASYGFIPSDGDQVFCVLTSSETLCVTGNPATSNTITMTVNPNLPVSVTISADVNPVCEGGLVTFTATPVNGGALPAYQWLLGGSEISGATEATYSYVPENGDKITCEMTSDAPCTSGNPAISNEIEMIVNPILPVSITINADATEVCDGTPVNFTSNIINGGASPIYQWFVNGLETEGATNSTFSFNPVNNDQVTCELTSSETVCVTGNPALSNAVGIVVNPLLPVSVSILENQNPVCEGTMVNFTATPVNGGTTPTYQWLVNSLEMPGATNATYEYIPANNDEVQCRLVSSETCTSGNPASSNTILMVVNPLLPVGVTVAASENPVCDGATVTFTATPVNGGTTPVYKWFVNNIEVSGATEATYSYIPVTSDEIFCALTSSETCTTGNPANSNTITMIVNPLLDVTAVISADLLQVCEGETVNFSAITENGGTEPQYDWSVNGVSYPGATNSTFSYIPNHQDTVRLTFTSNAPCAINNPRVSNALGLVVNPLLPVSILIAPDANPVCAGTQVGFVAIPENGGSAPAYQWQLNATDIPGATNSTFDLTPDHGDIITCILTSDEVCASGNPATSNAVTMTVNPLLPVEITIAPDQNPVYEGVTVTFTATPVNGGANPAYQWKVNGSDVSGATNATYAYIPVNGDAVTCLLTSDALCATGSPALSNTVVMIVDPSVPVSVTIEADNNPVCTGSTVNFTAYPVNGGSTPAYQWKVNGSDISGASSSTYSYLPTHGDIVTCVLTSSLEHTTGNPATSNAIVMTVNPLLPVSVLIAPDANPVCSGTLVNFLAIPFNGGTTPVFQWKINGSDISGATEATYSYIPVNGDMVSCLMTSGETCTSGNPATSNPVTMTVNTPVPVSVTVVADQNPVCQGTSVGFTATPVNGGSNPVYQWSVNGSEVEGATNSTWSYNPVDQDAVTCELTSDLTCTSGNPATSGPVVMTVNTPDPVSVTIEAGSNPICQGSSVTMTATPVNGGLAPQYQWKKNLVDVPGATNSTWTFIPVNGDAVACVVTSSATCITGNPATSNSIVVNVSPLLQVVVFIGADVNPVCEGTPVNFAAFPLNGGSAPLFQWQINGGDVSGATDASYSYSPAHGDNVTCLLTSSEACATGNPALSNTITMTVNPAAPVSVSIVASANPVCEGTSVNFTATPVNGGATPDYQWMLNSIPISGATSSGYSAIPLNGAIYSCQMTSSLECTSGNPATSNSLTMTVNPILPVSITIQASATTVCSETEVTFTATPVNGGSVPSYQWLVNGSNVTGATNQTYTFVPVNGNTVSCILNSNASCVSGNPATSNTIVMTVNTRPTPTIISGSSSVCEGSNILMYQTQAGMSNYSWTISPGGNIIQAFSNTVFVTWPVAGSQWIKVNYTNASGCSAVSPTQFNVTVHPIPVPVITGDIVSCAGATGIVYSTASGMSNYSWSLSSGGVNTGGGTSTSNTMTVTWNTAGDQWVKVSYTGIGGCPAAAPTTLNVTVNSPVTPSLTITASANPVDAGTEVVFSSVPVNEGASPIYQWHVNGAPVSGATGASYSYAPSNNDAVTCVMTSSLSCVTANPVISNSIVMIVNSLPINLTVSDVTVTDGQTVCYNALDTIFVAGNSTVFNVNAGGSATFIAGKSIFFLPGTTVAAGGYLLGKIAPEGPFCDGILPPAMASVITGNITPEPVIEKATFVVYPNPTSGNFTILRKGESSVSDIRIEVYSMNGRNVMTESLVGEKFEMHFSDMAPGLYFVKVITPETSETIKLVKTR